MRRYVRIDPMVLLAPMVRRFLAKHHQMRRSQFEALSGSTDRVVFLGDSITDGGLWHEWFPDLPTLNRGMSGDTVEGVHARLDSAVQEPRLVSLLIGTNNLSRLGAAHRPEEIATAVGELLDAIRAMAPDAPLLLNSVMPRSRALSARIEDLNDRYRELAQRNGVTYIDLWPALAAPDRTLATKFTQDGTHLNGEGYRAWVEVLRPHLASVADPGQSARQTPQPAQAGPTARDD